MAFDRFLIGPLNTGLEKDLKSWLIPDDAFAQLTNAYVFRGRVRKRFGSTLSGYGRTDSTVATLNSRLAVPLASTDVSGNASGTVDGAPGKVGQLFSIGNAIFTVTALGTPATLLRSDGVGGTATFDTTTGAYVINGATPSTVVYFYPTRAVTGLANYQAGAINNQPVVAFDRQFAYSFISGFWQRISTTAGLIPVIWHGTNANFFWTANWTGITADSTVLFASNFNATVSAAPGLTDDPIWYYDGTNWTVFNPKFKTAGGATSNVVKTARIIVPFKDRLVFLNTIESNGTDTFNSAYKNRCRYSQNGSPLDASAWLEKNQTGYKGAGYIDATTEEAIISAEFIKDRLIVYFERSTWELAYTGNQILPFVWQKINTELGSESTFSVVPFDKVILTVGTTGVHACNGANVERIDDKIPDEVFDIRNDNQGASRVAGIRDYITEMVYWSMPTYGEQSNANMYPNKVLVYNYKNGSWALNDDCITAFGYFEQQQDTTWQSAEGTWQQANFSWVSGVRQANSRQIIAGNQQGFIFIIRADQGSNASVMQITNMAVAAPGVTLTIIDHTLAVGDYIKIDSAKGVTGLNNKIYQITSIADANTVTIAPASYTGTYLGGGVVSRISNIQIDSKQWNPYVDKSRNVYVAKIDFGVKRTANGQVTVDYSPSSSNLSMLEDAYDSGALLGSGILETSPYALIPLEKHQDRLWHPVYLQTEGECIQISIYMSDAQMRDVNIAASDFELEGMILYCMPTTLRLQ